MQITKLTTADYSTSRWSGGTTTQIAIFPPDANYGERTFFWRVSSATIELPTSSFTPLPQYHRYLATLDSPITLIQEEEQTISLAPLTVYAFDGGIPTQSIGNCTDFNLMLRKGQCEGKLMCVTLSPKETHSVQTASPAEGNPAQVLIYCVKGEMTATIGEKTVSLQQGETLIAEDSFPLAINLSNFGDIIGISMISTVFPQKLQSN